ncbi:MAG: ABC transporter ATP-binding protein/permease, partial [Propionibacteriaceae bacterium]|nr:ABC transporter ATP-binding protein/permease [Propionibacteriaceae bacterium]
MSENNNEERKAPERPKYSPKMRGGGHSRGTGEKAINFVPSLKRLLSHLSGEIAKLVLVVFCLIVSTLAGAANPMILGWGTDVIFNSVQAGRAIDFGALGRILLLALGAAALNGALSLVCGLLINGIVQRTIYRMRKQIEEKLNKLPLSYFDRQPRGELLSRVTNDIDNIAQSLQQTLNQVLSNIFTLLSVIVMMFIINWVLALVTLITIPIALAVTVFVGSRAQKLFTAMWKNTGDLNSMVEEAYTGHQLVKVFGRQEETLKLFQAKNEELFQAAFGAQFISSMIMPLMNFVSNLNFVIIAIAGGMMVISGNLNLGGVQAFIVYSKRFAHPITQLASMANLLQSGVASAERVFEILDAEEEAPDGEGALPSERDGRVGFEHVSFSYTPEKPLIKDLSLMVRPGSTVAIVGPTGAGKTTMVNLIMRFYELNGGMITLDGVDISSIRRHDLREQIGMVLQDTWLFHGTIRENIAYGKVGATDEEVIAAAKAAYVDRFVRSLPEGYETMINDEASNVSAGEKQLITIARAFISDPALLILDEATSSVDTRTELLLQRAMGKLRADRTSFVIAHRLSTIRDADTILVMENGDIVEQGNHEELLAKQGAYYRLYRAQFAGQ